MKFPSRVLHILTDTDDLPQGYCGYASSILMIFLTDTEDGLYRVLLLEDCKVAKKTILQRMESKLLLLEFNVRFFTS